ncbi:PREDICTED: berberine bridge enzyme-like 28 [Nicotiana attenuata]|uniref:Flavin-dependent oxidoreductase fox2 n=1 Tax=Nicotiana attenuata TaxID=49451 RepID=A0A0K0K5B3_NICAT|nr:PREDICTED: berberine bridge enzyme-like 28 [Nicotiana attenuata]AGI92937.1 nectarin 5b [Nicotiana attenuata]OIT21775.1 flavin-dependent oxidoreductase fox2 [Nicotiana attenuata]
MTIYWLSCLSLLVLSSSLCTACADTHEKFLQCLSVGNNQKISFYTRNNKSYSSILQFSIQNLRFNFTKTPKPRLIVTPVSKHEIQQVILCAKKTSMHVRVRSGGHDPEGLSYVSNVPFVLIDLIKFRKITINVKEKSAWVDTGSSIGELYYKIAKKSKTLGFSAAVYPIVGAGGAFSGGGTGVMIRKYGLAADNIIDARLMDVNGKILDRKSMGEDLFWAIRGGGGNTFGIVLAWKIKLADVPEKVIVFTIDKTLKQNATKLIHKWQYVSPKFHQDLFIRVVIRKNKQNALVASFYSIFLGGNGIDQLLGIMHESFPELGLKREDCMEMSWIESTLYFAGYSRGESLDVLLKRGKSFGHYFKVKSDFVQKPISKRELEGIWDLFKEDEDALRLMFLTPYGGKMDEISENEIPYPHRAGNLYEIQYGVSWFDKVEEEAERHINWIRKLYEYMTPLVSKSPRAAYVNYRDLDIGANNMNEKTSYEQAKAWGYKYFKNNFDRLVQVKTKVDPSNFFRNEQSIPPFEEK